MTKRELDALYVVLKNAYTVGYRDAYLKVSDQNPAFKDPDDYATHSLSVFKSMSENLGLDKKV